MSHLGSMSLSFLISQMRPVIPTSQGLREEGTEINVRVKALDIVITMIQKSSLEVVPDLTLKLH